MIIVLNTVMPSVCLPSPQTPLQLWRGETILQIDEYT